MLTLEELAAARETMLRRRARATFLYHSALHFRRKADHLWAALRQHSLRGGHCGRHWQAYDRACRMFLTRLAEQKSLTIELVSNLYMRGDS